MESKAREGRYVWTRTCRMEAWTVRGGMWRQGCLPGLLSGSLRSCDRHWLEGQWEGMGLGQLGKATLPQGSPEALSVVLANMLAFSSTLTYITLKRTWHRKHAHIHFLEKKMVSGLINFPKSTLCFSTTLQLPANRLDVAIWKNSCFDLGLIYVHLLIYVLLGENLSFSVVPNLGKLILPVEGLGDQLTSQHPSLVHSWLLWTGARERPLGLPAWTVHPGAHEVPTETSRSASSPVISPVTFLHECDIC